MAGPKHDMHVDGDYTVPQDWARYTDLEHQTWNTLYRRQVKTLSRRACPEFLDGLTRLNLDAGGIPDFRRLNEALHALTGWTVVAVPDLVPDAAFFELLANRQFPAGRFIRRPEQMDYLEEPDVFHDVFGHVPMLSHPVFADYMEAYGKGGLRALKFDALTNLARLYWYTVEFGLVQSADGLRIYGAGIASSKSECAFSLESRSPNRLRFELERVMRTDYRIDDFQQTYFVIDSFERLFEDTYQDFAPIYRRLDGAATIAPDAILARDQVLNRGDQSHANTLQPGG